MALQETIAMMQEQRNWERMSDHDRAEHLIANLEPLTNLCLLLADGMERFDDGENERISALIASLALAAKEADRIRAELTTTYSRIVSARLRAGKEKA